MNVFLCIKLPRGSAFQNGKINCKECHINFSSPEECNFRGKASEASETYQNKNTLVECYFGHIDLWYFWLELCLFLLVMITFLSKYLHGKFILRNIWKITSFNNFHNNLRNMVLETGDYTVVWKQNPILLNPRVEYGFYISL